MGLFDKLFGNKQDGNKDDSSNAVQISKTAELLDEDLYWKIIDSSLKNTSDQDSQEQFLVAEISKLTPTQMIGFRLRTDKLLYDTYTSEMWCAGYIMNGGCSDDGFEYFRNWIISRGKDVYYKAKENPDTLISEFIEDADFYDFESFWYVALDAFEQKTGKELYDFIDYDNFNYGESKYPAIEFTWQEDDIESWKKICPNIYSKFAHNYNE